MRCPVCGAEHPPGARFCADCGAPLAPTRPPPGEERKVVSVLFCDLVGFTAASEHADPEDVRARLRPYHAMLRSRMEAFGGTVEKFIGDAVMAVFGAPTAHEDDPERAVRAGLAILVAVEELNGDNPALGLSVRVGVNTGEAVVALGARPAVGEGFVTGDVVNTAARIQAAAPVGAVAVGEATHAATAQVFDYQRLEPVAVKGKSAPVELWRAGAPRARFGVDVLRSMERPLVGRELELLQLRTAFDRTARDSSVQLVTVTGEPGVGKSRLVAELAAYTESLTDLVTWRAGRCLPYGDGITFWALGEIVKAHAGVLETDGPAEAAAKLDAVLPAGQDATWWRARLLPLLGVDTGVAVSREESFTAWRRFIESLAATRPAVVVVEDIHWADAALLAFLEHLVGWAHGVPLLVVATARPELLETHPHWGAGLRNAMTVALAGLSEADTARLVAHMLGRALLPAATQRLVLDRAEGNPLYAEECARVLHDRDLLDAAGNLRGQGEVPLPAGISALIAARLDTLSPDRKALLADAAVIGRVFWAGALTAMGGREPAAVATALHELTGREFIRPARGSSLAGQEELAFWHALVRDVAYGSIPRPARAAKHLAAARWLEAEATGRVADLAEVLAHHSGSALTLARAAGDSALAAEVVPLARRHALLAADKAIGLDAAAAMSLLDRALALTPADDPEHPAVLVRWAETARQAGRLREAAEALARAADASRGRGDLVAAGVAMARLASVQADLGAPDARATAGAAVELLETQPLGAEVVDALTELAGLHLVRGENRDLLAVADRAAALAESLHLPAPVRAISYRGFARAALGDREGLTDIGHGLALLMAADRGHQAAVQYNNLGAGRWPFDGPAAALVTYAAGEAFALARGLATAVDYIRSSALQALVETGSFDEALRRAEMLRAGGEATGDWNVVLEAGATAVRVLFERGETCRGDAEAVVAAALRINTSNAWAIAVPSAALARVADGDRAGGLELLRELDANPNVADLAEYPPRLPALVRCAIAAGDPELGRRLTDAMPTRLPVARHALVTARALLAQDAGDHAVAVAGFTDAAARWAAFGNRLEQAYALLGLGQSLLVQGASAEQALRQARELFAEMGAHPRVQECELLLAGAAGQTA